MELSKSATAGTVMSSPVRTISPTATIDVAQRLLLRYGHSGLCVVNGDRDLVGVISRRDIETSLRHGFGRSIVSDLMSHAPIAVNATAPLVQIQHMMLTHDIGRVPVVDAGKLVGIVTRSDLLRCVNYPEDSISRNNFFYRRPPSSAALQRQLAARLPEVWPVLMQLAAVAEQKGWSLYIVGGAVRDLLLALAADPVAASENSLVLSDIDVVVEGAEESAGVSLAEAMRSRYPQVDVQVYGQFQTASLKWPAEGKEPLVLDIATARTEFYPYPAANPEVEASSIHQDLYRRDFTINAMAIALTETSLAMPAAAAKDGVFCKGRLIDFFGGWSDLNQQHIRVLHNNSFIEDPTRIFRAVRFAARLGFDIEPETARLIKHALSSGIYDSIREKKEKVPALQSRLTAELKYLLSETTWQEALNKAAHLGALSCIHTHLNLTPNLCQQLRRMNRWLSKLRSKQFIDKFGIKALANMPPQWLMSLELMIAQLDIPLREQVAAALSLDKASRHRLQNLHVWEAQLAAQMSQVQRPSQLFSLLRSYEQPALLLIGDRHPYTLGPQIWQYVVQLSNPPSLLTGRHLKQIGYTPGPLFREILTDVSYLAMDGELGSVEDAQAYVLAQYPQPSR